MNCLGLNHSSRGHVIVFLFYLAIGIAFLISSIVYLLNLERISTSLLHPNCTTGNEHDDHQKHGTRVKGLSVSCELFKIWLSIGSVATVYGGLCVIIAMVKLYTIFKKYPTAARHKKMRHETNDDEEGASSSSKNSEPSASSNKAGSLKAATGLKAVKRARQLISKKTRWNYQNQDLTCVGCFGIFIEFLLAIFFWLASLLLPLYVGWRLVSSDAIRVDDDQLYALSLAIFCVALVNLTVVAGSSIVMTMEAEEDIEKDLKEEWEQTEQTLGEDFDSSGLGSLRSGKGWSFSGSGGETTEEEQRLIGKAKNRRTESV